jgi:hypothetical protein
MSATVSYEVHVMRGARWVTSGIYQDKNDALREARGPMRKRYLSVRVIEEIFDPERDRFVTRTIYRDTTQAAACGPKNRPASSPVGGAITMDGAMERGGEPMTAAAMTLLSVAAFLLVAISGLFWLGAV